MGSWLPPVPCLQGFPGALPSIHLPVSDQETPSHLPSLGLCPGSTALWEPTPIAAVPPLGQHSPSLHCPSGPSPGTLCPAPYTATECHGKHSTIFSLALLKQPTTMMPPKLPRCSAALRRKRSRERGLWDLHGSPAPFPASPPTLPALTWPPGPSFHMGRPICSDGQRPFSPAMPCAPPSPDGCCPPSTSSQLRSHFQGRP